jgi:hypothetical protein
MDGIDKIIMAKWNDEEWRRIVQEAKAHPEL